MILTKTYKFKLYRSKKNRHLHQQIDIAGLVYNHCIALYRRYYRLTGKSLSQYELMKHLTQLKKLPRYAHWKLVGSQALQEIAQRIDRAYKLFFGNLKRKVKTAPPGFKKVKKYSSFTLKQAGYKVLAGNRIRIQDTVYKFSKSRDIPTEVKTLTVKRDASGNLYLYFVVQEESDPTNQVMTGNSAGFDFGLQTFLTTSEGREIESPLYYLQAWTALKQAQQHLARKARFSGGWQQAHNLVARIYQGVVNKRRDWFFKLAHELTDRYDALFLEDLARSEFIGILQYIASIKGKVVHLVDRFYSSSKTCSDCGHIQSLELSQRHWVCDGCGVNHDRDFNAAVNIHREGASSLRVGRVRLPSGSGDRLSLESHLF